MVIAGFIFLVILLASSCGTAVSVEESTPGTGGAFSLQLSWTAPTTNVDDTPLTDLAGYKLYYGNQSGTYSNVVDVGNYTTAEIGNLVEGTYYVAVTAYDIYGNESGFSNEIHHDFF